MKYDFDKDLELSQKYEKKFADYLMSKGVPKVKLAPKCRYEDYDVLSGVGTFEIKYDRWMQSTNNFCLETMSCVENNSLGWFFKTKADKIIVFYNDTDFVHISMKELADNWFDRPEIWEKKIIQQEGWTTVVWLANCNNMFGLMTGSVKDE